MACSVSDVTFDLFLSACERGRSLGDALALTTSVKKVFRSPVTPAMRV